MMVSHKFFRVGGFILFIIPISANSQILSDLALNSDLFKSESPLEITLEMDIRTVIRDIIDRKEYPAKLTYKSDDGRSHLFELKVRTRGNTRSNRQVCGFPPLMLNFKKKQTINTIFEGQDKIKMVAHCDNTKTNERYVLHEYLIYKQFNILTEESFKVRLLKVTYRDTQEKFKQIETFGFLVEDKDLMARRNNSMIINKELYHQDMCNQSSLDLMVVFQYMIGNTDWSVTALHNMKLIVGDTKALVPVPYDFDFSGLVYTDYAAPAPGLPIENVRTRIFRGFCRRPGVYEKVFEKFNQHKDEMYSLYANFALLDKKHVKSTLKYLDQFYKTINNPKLFRYKINRVCPIIHNHLYNTQ